MRGTFSWSRFFLFLTFLSSSKGPFTQSIDISISGNAKKWVRNPFTLQHQHHHYCQLSVWIESFIMQISHLKLDANANADALCERALSSAIYMEHRVGWVGSIGWYICNPAPTTGLILHRIYTWNIGWVGRGSL